MMHKKYIVYLLCVLMCVLCHTGYSSETVEREIKQLQAYVLAHEYKQALYAVDTIRGEIYDLLSNEKAPELRDHTYINHYFKFQISNPVEEWKMRKINSDAMLAKRKRLVKDLVSIDNVMSPYGLMEHLMVSVYDVGASSYKEQIESLEFRPQYFLQQIAEKIYKQQLTGDAELLEKESFEFQGNPAYRIVFRIDTGNTINVNVLHYFVYVPQQQYVLTFSFIMQTDNYLVYKYVFEEILNSIRFSEHYQDDVNVVRRSFMDIYLERQGQ